MDRSQKIMASRNEGVAGLADRGIRVGDVHERLPRLPPQRDADAKHADRP